MYPSRINKRIAEVARPALTREPDASGRAATFVCGVFVEFELCIDADTGTIEEAVFRTNGCGFAVAAADLIARSVKNTRLAELHALHDLENLASEALGEVPVGRKHCVDLCFDGLQKVLADYRLTRVEGWNGEDALVCSCFGVSESAIEATLKLENLDTVDAVGEFCRAGTGCGSCQPLIQEILDSHPR